MSLNLSYLREYFIDVSELSLLFTNLCFPSAMFLLHFSILFICVWLPFSILFVFTSPQYFIYFLQGFSNLFTFLRDFFHFPSEFLLFHFSLLFMVFFLLLSSHQRFFFHFYFLSIFFFMLFEHSFFLSQGRWEYSLICFSRYIVFLRFEGS